MRLNYFFGAVRLLDETGLIQTGFCRSGSGALDYSLIGRFLLGDKEIGLL